MTLITMEERMPAIHIRHRLSIVCIASLVISLLFPGGGVHAQDQSDIAKSCIQAIEAIETVKAGVLNATTRSPLPANAEVTDNGRLILHDFIVSWEKSSGRSHVEGRFFSVMDEVGLFTPFKGAYDGKTFKTLNTASKRGQLIEAGSNLAKYRHISMLTGCGVIEHPSRDVSEILSHGSVRLIADTQLENGPPIIEVTYFEHEGLEHEARMLLRVTVDLDHGALPSRIQCIKAKENVLQT